MANRYWVGGTGTWNGTSTTNWSASSGGASGASVPTSADNVFFDANSNTGTAAFTVTMATVAAVCADFDASAVDGVMTLAGTVAFDVYGSFSFPPTNRFTRSYTGLTTFRATTTGKTISLNGGNLNNAVFDGVGGGWALSNAFLTFGSTTLTNGSLDLNGFTLTSFSFISTNSNARTLAFNGGSINLTANVTGSSATLWSCATATNFTITGTPTVNSTANSTSGTRTFSHGNTAGGSENNSINLTILLGSNSANLMTVQGAYRNLNFSNISSTLNNSSRTIYENLTISSSMTLNGGASSTTFGSTNATTRTITTAGKTLDFPLTFSGVGGSWQLQDALTVGTTRAINLNNGSFNSGNQSITTGTFNYNNSNTKSLLLGTSTVTITGGTSTSGFVGSNSGTTYDVVNSTIVFTNTGAFAGGSSGLTGTQFGTITMSATSGTLYLGITGTTVARCTTLNNTVSPCTITNACTTGFTVDNFNVNGTAGNLVTLNSTVAGTARTISKSSGTVNANYLSIQDSTATGGATWNAYNSVKVSNNTGWIFIYDAATVIASTSEVFISADKLKDSGFNIDSVSALTTNAERVCVGLVAIDGTSAVTTNAERIFIGSIAIDGTSEVSISADKLKDSALAIASTSDVTINGLRYAVGVLSIDGVSTVDINARATYNQGIAIGAESSVSIVCAYTTATAMSIGAESSITVNAQRKWELQPVNPETWNPVADNSETWTEQQLNSSSWTPASGSSNSWSVIGDNQNSWTPQ